MTTLRSAFLLSLAAMSAGAAFADPASLTSAPVGLRDTTLKALSDTIVATAYTRPPAYVGKVASGGAASLAVAGSPGWATTRFAYAAGTQSDHFYAVLGAGPAGTTNPLEGLAYDIVSNTSGGLSLNTGDDLSSVPPGTTVTILPHWTLATLFPATDAGASFVTTTSPLLRRTQILFPDLTAQGINPAASATFYFYNGAWRQFGQAVTADYGDTPLPDSSYMIVRNNGPTDLRLRLTGAVSTGKLTRAVDTLASNLQDNCLSTGRPVPVTLSAAGLITSGALLTSTSALNRKDQLLVFDNTVAGYNKAAATTYYYYNGAWRKFGASVTAAFDTDTLAPDAGFILRKASAPGSPDWTATPAFPTP